MSAVEETADGPVDVIQVLFALHPGFGAQELCGPLEILSKAYHKINDPSEHQPPKFDPADTPLTRATQVPKLRVYLRGTLSRCHLLIRPYRQSRH